MIYSKRFYLTIIVSVFIVFIYEFLFVGQFMYSKYSPNGKYRVDVYTKMSLFAMPGGGGMSGRTALVVLKNRWGYTIGKSSDECSVSYYDLDIKWTPTEVYFSKVRSINLETGKCEY